MVKIALAPRLLFYRMRHVFCCPAESQKDSCQIRLLLVHGLNPNATGREAQGKKLKVLNVKVPSLENTG